MKTQYQTWIGIVFAAMALLLPTLANATLSDRGNGLIYDSTLNVTWMQNAMLAATNTFGVTHIDSYGFMTWDTANNWIDAMNAAHYKGYDDWRLPTTTPADCGIGGASATGYNKTCSEMGSLYYLSLPSSSSPTDPYYPFHNVMPYHSGPFGVYWSGTEAVQHNNSDAWIFRFNGGLQEFFDEDIEFSAWAVRSGDVLGDIAAVPGPGALGLFAAGLILLGLCSRRRRQFHGRAE